MDNYTKKHLQDILTAIEEIESFFDGCPKCFMAMTAYRLIYCGAL